MNYQSTRNHRLQASSAAAVLEGIAADGGLYIRDDLSTMNFDWEGLLGENSLTMSARILSALLPDIPDMETLVKQGYEGKFETDELTPLAQVGDRYVLELFRGPTSAFKDVALSLLPRLITSAKTVCGVDEAGAGPLMGPVYAAAVILPRGCVIDGLNDSKKLTPKKRDALYDVIIAEAEAWAVASVSAAEIDATDILSARMKAMQLAIDALAVRPDFALIDGNRDHGKSAAVTALHACIIGGDGCSASIAAASILAKVSRDRYVTDVLDPMYPQYGFAKHKGYGTRDHYAMLDQYGPCPEHRMTFLKKWKAGKQ